MSTTTIELHEGRRITLSITPKDADGAAANVDGLPTWTTSNAVLAGLHPVGTEDPDDVAQESITAASVEVWVPAGTLEDEVDVSVFVEADANLSGEVDTIREETVLRLIPAQAESLNVGADAERPLPARTSPPVEPPVEG